VVRDQVHEHLQAAGVRLRQECVQRRQVAVRRLDAGVVGDVVPVVGLWRRIARIQPDPVNAEIDQVVQAGAEAGEVTDAVAVTVGEAADVDLVDDRVAPPRGGTYGAVNRCGQSSLS